MKQSIWKLDTTFPSFPALEGDAKTDVLILGGGLAGILIARELKLLGMDYMLIEADRIMSGTSGNTTAKITSQHGLIYGKLLRKFGPEGARTYWEAQETALSALGELCRERDCDYEKKDNFIFSRDSIRPLEVEYHALGRLNIPAELDTSADLPFPVAGALRFPDQAQFHPGKLAAAITPGMNIFEHTAAREIRDHQVVTDRGTVTAEKIIVATHFPIVNRYGAYFLKMYQSRSYVLALKNASKVRGMYLDYRADGLSFRNQGEYLLLGSGGHRTGKQGMGWKELRAAAAEFYPQSRVVCRWAAQDCMTLDGMPYIGRYSPRTPDLYVATGFNKWGMTASMLSALILRDLIRGRENAFGDLFSPSRSMLRPQLLLNMAHSTVNLLTPTAPRCPHMGCALKWNPAEHSWDCPCHGSRFTAEGELLENPARKNLRDEGTL